MLFAPSGPQGGTYYSYVTHPTVKIEQNGREHAFLSTEVRDANTLLVKRHLANDEVIGLWGWGEHRLWAIYAWGIHILHPWGSICTVGVSTNTQYAKACIFAWYSKWPLFPATFSPNPAVLLFLMA